MTQTLTGRGEVKALPRVEKKDATKRTGQTVDLRPFASTGSKQHARGVFTLVDPTAQEGEVIYTCDACSLISIGPAVARGDDIRCGQCRRTNESAIKEFSSGGLADDEDEKPSATIKPAYKIEDGFAVAVSRARRKTRKQIREGDLGEAVSTAANRARSARRKKERTSLARRRGRAAS